MHSTRYTQEIIYVQRLVSLAGFVWVLYWAASGFLCFWVCIFFFLLLFLLCFTMIAGSCYFMIPVTKGSKSFQCIIIPGRDTDLRALGVWVLSTWTFWLREILLPTTPGAGCYTRPYAMWCDPSSLPASATLIISVQSLFVACCISRIVQGCHSENNLHTSWGSCTSGMEALSIDVLGCCRHCPVAGLVLAGMLFKSLVQT